MDQSNIHLLKIPDYDKIKRKAEWLQEHGYYTHLSIIELMKVLEKKEQDEHILPKP